MKNFIRKNLLISIFGLISILITVSYAITYNMPDYFSIEGWYSLLNNISISYIAALIFYVFQVYKPERENGKKAQAILQPLFSELIRFIEVTIACCRSYVSLDENNVVKINWYDKEQKIIYFVPITEDSDKPGHRPAARKTFTELKELENVYKSKIREIKERIDFRDCNPELLTALSELEATNFFKSTFNVALMLEETFIKVPHFHEGIDEFEVLKDKFKKLCNVTCKYKVRAAETMEVAATEAIYQHQALQLKSVDEFTEATYREYLKLQLKAHITDENQLDEIIDSVLPDAMKKIKDKM